MMGPELRRLQKSFAKAEKMACWNGKRCSEIQRAAKKRRKARGRVGGKKKRITF